MGIPLLWWLGYPTCNGNSWILVNVHAREQLELNMYFDKFEYPFCFEDRQPN